MDNLEQRQAELRYVLNALKRVTWENAGCSYAPRRWLTQERDRLQSIVDKRVAKKEADA